MLVDEEDSSEENTSGADLTTEERNIFERLRDEYGTDDEIGRIAAHVIQASESSEEARS